ncbi:hypothetical protein EBT23_01370 [bacterium]|nr:hypothetical protein [Verrucomicrobiota bacterium]NBS54216.1 hypothetical protein [bacterium]
MNFKKFQTGTLFQPKKGATIKSMKSNPPLATILRNLALAGFASSLLSVPALAGLATPVAVNTLTVPSSTTAVLGTPYARPVEAFGTVSSTSVTNSNTLLTVSVDLNGGSPALPAGTGNTDTSLSNTDENVDGWWVVEILDGPAIGLVLDVVGGTSNSITVKGTLPSSINLSSGSKFALRRAWTLASLLGTASTTNPFGYGSTPTATTVNGNVQILDSASGSLTTYYINKVGTGSANWRSSQTGTANKNHVPLGLGKGFIVVNLKTNPLTFTVSGDYRTARTRLIMAGGKKTLLANPGVYGTDFIASGIPTTSPNRANSIPNAATDSYQVWSTSAKAFALYRMGDATSSNGPTAFLGSTRTNPAISAFSSILVTPYGSNPAVITISPALNP